MRATTKELRSFGIVVGIAFAVLAGAQILFHGRLDPRVLFGISAALILLGLVAPALLRPFHRVWMKLADVLGWVMNRILLGVTFFVIFTLVSLILKLIRRDRLRLAFKKKQESYWLPRAQTAPPPESYERQF